MVRRRRKLLPWTRLGPTPPASQRCDRIKGVECFQPEELVRNRSSQQMAHSPYRGPAGRYGIARLARCEPPTEKLYSRKYHSTDRNPRLPGLDNSQKDLGEAQRGRDEGG